VKKRETKRVIGETQRKIGGKKEEETERDRGRGRDRKRDTKRYTRKDRG
jgi:hypothetical protein